MSISPVQHQEDQTLPVWARSTTPGTGSRYIIHWLLQLLTGRSPRMYIQTSADDPEWGGTAGLQLAQNSICQPAVLFISLHWLPVAARIKFKTLTLTCKTATKTAPAYLNSLIQIYTPSCSLHSANGRCHHNSGRIFSSVVPRLWNKLPNSVWSAESLWIFKKRLKTQLFRKHLHTWTEKKEMKKKSVSMHSMHCLCALLVGTYILLDSN